MLHSTRGTRGETLSSDKEVPFDVAAHCAQEGIKGGKKRRKQHLQGTTAMASHDDGHDRVAGGSGVRRISTAEHNDKRSTRPPTEHFKRLLE
jgi:hypothetical protein